MKALKIVTILVVVYAGIVITFESLMGYFQPEYQKTLVITTTDQDGQKNDRVLVRLESNDLLYVAANHWPRAWYNQALANPNVQIDMDGELGNYEAVPVVGEEHDRIKAENKLGMVILFLTGFPPRYFVRLDPQ
jgi:hypothetical protein